MRQSPPNTESQRGAMSGRGREGDERGDVSLSAFRPRLIPMRAAMLACLVAPTTVPAPPLHHASLSNLSKCDPSTWRRASTHLIACSACAPSRLATNPSVDEARPCSEAVSTSR